MIHISINYRSREDFAFGLINMTMNFNATRMEIIFILFHQTQTRYKSINFIFLQFKNKLKSLSLYTCIREGSNNNLITYFYQRFLFHKIFQPWKNQLKFNSFFSTFSRIRLCCCGLFFVFETRQNIFFTIQRRGQKLFTTHTHPKVWKDNGKSFFRRFFTVNEMRQGKNCFLGKISTVRRKFTKKIVRLIWLAMWAS